MGKRQREEERYRPQILQPEGWPPPRGYANGVVASGRMVFTGGLVGWDAAGRFPDGFVAQVRQTLLNTLAVLAPPAPGRSTWCA
jgi:enamine deaminase RidA (YjgF/YER057c/UK114 family)